MPALLDQETAIVAALARGGITAYARSVLKGMRPERRVAIIDRIQVQLAKRHERPRVICAWCQKVLRDGPQDRPISHGMCEPCKDQFNQETA